MSEQNRKEYYLTREYNGCPKGARLVFNSGYLQSDSESDPLLFAVGNGKLKAFCKLSAADNLVGDLLTTTKKKLEPFNINKYLIGAVITSKTEYTPATIITQTAAGIVIAIVRNSDSNYHIYTADLRFLTYTELLHDFLFINGTPCGWEAE